MWLRPLGFGETLDEIFRFYRRNFLLMAVLALLPTLPPLLFQIGSGQPAQYGQLAGAFANLGNPQYLPTAGPFSGLGLALLLTSYLVAIALSPFSTGLVQRAGLDVAFAQPTTIWLVLRAVARRYLGLLAVLLLTLLVALPMVTCLLIPLSLWILVRWSVAVPVMLAEGAGPLTAISRSWDLTRGSWWRVFGILIVVFLIQYVGGLLVSEIGLPVALAVPFLPPLARGLVLVTVNTVGGALLAPISGLCFVLIYLDVRVRLEHLDLWQLADQAVAAVR
ncbi:MAG: glycerophosphoryl diester phosphodiesterase membrane domain-containing protein [Candidatus Dormibacteraeota bacterium]|nr:glycerophosphoryl diester phosphodiesterase membrane domain-containing protein [Candidatus Dormibacteraeota bacterium]